MIVRVTYCGRVIANGAPPPPLLQRRGATKMASSEDDDGEEELRPVRERIARGTRAPTNYRFNDDSDVNDDDAIGEQRRDGGAVGEGSGDCTGQRQLIDRGVGTLVSLSGRSANPGPQAKFGPRRIFEWPAWPCKEKLHKFL